MIFMPFFPRSLYRTRTVATEIIEGMILSNRSATARLTSPIWNARGVFAVTTVADRAPTTVRPRTEAASVMRASLLPTLVISLVPSRYPIHINWVRMQMKIRFTMSHRITPMGLPSRAIYPAMEPMIVGSSVQNKVSPIPAKGPIKLTLIFCTASREEIPSLSSRARVAPRTIFASHGMVLKYL